MDVCFFFNWVDEGEKSTTVFFTFQHLYSYSTSPFSRPMFNFGKLLNLLVVMLEGTFLGSSVWTQKCLN